jgi:acetyltransferase-like isoleucine patch superfamily enzyme
MTVLVASFVVPQDDTVMSRPHVDGLWEEWELDAPPVGFRQVGSDVTIHPLAKINGRASISIGSHVVIDEFTFIGAHIDLVIGNYVHIATRAAITGGSYCVLHDFCKLSSEARIFTGPDDFDGCGIEHPTLLEELRKVARGSVVLESHVLIGSNAVIFPGVRIGEGAAVEAGSVVTRSLAPWGIYAGAPAQLLGRRRGAAIRLAEEQFYEWYGYPEPSFRSATTRAAA